MNARERHWVDFARVYVQLVLQLIVDGCERDNIEVVASIEETGAIKECQVLPKRLRIQNANAFKSVAILASTLLSSLKLNLERQC